MTPNEHSDLVFVLLYFGAAFWLLYFRGWPLRAGIATAAIVMWLHNLVDPDAAPGEGFLICMLFLLSTYMVYAGLIAGAVRLARYLRRGDRA